MDRLISNYKSVSFSSGVAVGADSFAEQYTKENGISVEVYTPDWKKYGKSAGFVRNKTIWDNADIGIAFWDGESKGTEHSFQIARDQKKKIYIAEYLNRTVRLVDSTVN